MKKDNIYIFAVNSVPHCYGTKTEVERAAKEWVRHSGKHPLKQDIYTGKLTSFSVL